MTKDEVLNMPAGREMDALIAEFIMEEKKPLYSHSHPIITQTKWSVTMSWYCSPEYEKGDVCEWIPKHYSTDIAAAWEVVEKLMQDGFIWKSNGNESCGNLIYIFSFAKDDGGYEEYFKTYDSGITENNLPLAICRAALLAVSEK